MEEFNMKWATRKNMKVDRASSYWLIKRYIDKNSEILLVEDSEIESLTQKGILTFDAEEAKYRHLDDPVWGKYGEKCTFQILMDEYELAGKDVALDLMGKIIYAADIGHKKGEFLPKEGYGIWALLQGFAIKTVDDVEKIDTLVEIFDSLYIYCESITKNI